MWLSHATGKSVLKLDDADYREHHLSALLARHGSAATLERHLFDALSAKIRGPQPAAAQGKRIIVFSPHPDDDVISAGGILHKLQRER